VHCGSLPGRLRSNDDRRVGDMVRAVVQVAAAQPGGSVVARLAADLMAELDGLTEQLVTALRETDKSYLPVDIADLHRYVHANLHSFLTDLASQSTPSTTSSRDTARRARSRPVSAPARRGVRLAASAR
jgi:hypothetical protein